MDPNGLHTVSFEQLTPQSRSCLDLPSAIWHFGFLTTQLSHEAPLSSNADRYSCVKTGCMCYLRHWVFSKLSPFEGLTSFSISKLPSQEFTTSKSGNTKYNCETSSTLVYLTFWGARQKVLENSHIKSAFSSASSSLSSWASGGMAAANSAWIRLRFSCTVCNLSRSERIADRKWIRKHIDIDWHTFQKIYLIFR